MGRPIPQVAPEIDYDSAIRKLLARMHQAVEDSDLTSHPPCVEWEQAHGECQELESRLRADGSSGQHIWEELQAWAEDRPLPALDHYRKTAGVEVTTPTTVATVLRRSGVEV
jgi:urease accessory protein UreF